MSAFTDHIAWIGHTQITRHKLTEYDLSIADSLKGDDVCVPESFIRNETIVADKDWSMPMAKVVRIYHHDVAVEFFSDWDKSKFWDGFDIGDYVPIEITPNAVYGTESDGKECVLWYDFLYEDAIADAERYQKDHPDKAGYTGIRIEWDDV